MTIKIKRNSPRKFVYPYRPHAVLVHSCPQIYERLMDLHRKCENRLSSDLTMEGIVNGIVTHALEQASDGRVMLKNTAAAIQNNGDVEF